MLATTHAVAPCCSDSVRALTGQRDGGVDIASDRANRGFADQRVEPRDEVAALGDLGRAFRGFLSLIELAQPRVAHRQRDERERRANEVVFLA